MKVFELTVCLGIPDWTQLLLRPNRLSWEPGLPCCTFLFGTHFQDEMTISTVLQIKTVGSLDYVGIVDFKISQSEDKSEAFCFS